MLGGRRKRQRTAGSFARPDVKDGIQIRITWVINQGTAAGAERTRRRARSVAERSDDEVASGHLRVADVSIRIPQNQHPATGLDQTTARRPADNPRKNPRGHHRARTGVVSDGDGADGTAEINTGGELRLAEGGRGSEHQGSRIEISPTPGHGPTANRDDETIRIGRGETGSTPGQLHVAGRRTERAGERPRGLEHAPVEVQ